MSRELETREVRGVWSFFRRPLDSIARVFKATDGRDILQNTPDGWEVDQPWLWWDGPADGDGTGGPFGNPPPGADRHRLLPAVARCRALICDTLAGVPWQVYRGDELLRTPDWILDPQGLRHDSRVQSGGVDVRHSAVEFWSAFILSAVEHGEGIVYAPVRDTDGQPVPPLFMMNPDEVDVRHGEYVVGDEVIDPDELLIVRGRTLTGKRRGRGVWDEFGDTLGLGGKVHDYAGTLLGRGIPAGYLKVTAPDLTQDEADRLKRRWMEAHGGSRRRIAVLNSTTEFTPLQLDPQAVQLAELLRLSAWEICLIYGIPPYKLGIAEGSRTYANIEQASIEYVQDSLLPWSRRIESAFDARFARGTSLKLNLDGLRRADTKTRYEAHKIALDAGWMTADEVRVLEDLPPLSDTQRAEASARLALLRPGDVETSDSSLPHLDRRVS